MRNLTGTMYLNDIAEAERIMCQVEQMIRRGYTTSERLFWKVEWEMMSMEAKGIRMDESTMLWNIDNFVLSDKNEDITYRAMKIAAINKPKIPCNLIVSAFMLIKLINPNIGIKQYLY